MAVAGWSAGIVLLVASGLVLLLQVSVPGAGTPPRLCGSAWDVVAGRAAWPQQQAADLSDPAAAPRRAARPDAALPRRRERQDRDLRRPGPGGGGSGAGGLLTAAGLAAIALLVADPRAAVLVRERPVVVLARLLLLLPAILLIVLGRAASMMARCLAHPEEVKASETP